jgi:hypothetical protein|tara:strand:- start:3455 stop:4171 length:717 start_codon:yes stop_codon:yes gene_type:complete
VAKVKTRGDAIAFAKNLLDERGNTFFSTTLQQTFVDEANRIVFEELVNTNYEFFLNTASFTYTADAERFDIQSTTVDSASAAATPYKIIDLGHTASSDAVSANNQLLQWRPMRFKERFAIQRQFGDYKASATYHWCLVGKYLYVAPMPSEALNCKIYYIAPLADMTNDNDELLGGYAHQSFGDAVGYCMAHLMNAKQHKENPMVEQLWASALERIRNCATSRVTEEGGHVRVTRHPWD